MKKNIFILLFINSILSANTLISNQIVTIGGSVTEIVFAIGEGHKVIAVDQSSTLPPEVKNLDQVGYIRSISAEGILSVRPNKILTTNEIGPPNVVKQIQGTGVDLVIFDSPKNFNDILKLIKEISEELNVENKGSNLINKMKSDYSNIQTKIKSFSKSNKIAFFMNSNNGISFNAAGSGTRANYLIEFIGGENIFKNEFKRYSKVSLESIISLNPDIILIASMSQAKTNTKSLYENTNLQMVNAVKNNQVHSIDLGQSLTFGSNLTDTALSLLNLIESYKSEKK